MTHGDNPPVKVLEVSARVWLLFNAFQLLESQNCVAHRRSLRSWLRLTIWTAYQPMWFTLGQPATIQGRCGVHAMIIRLAGTFLILPMTRNPTSNRQLRGLQRSLKASLSSMAVQCWFQSPDGCKGSGSIGIEGRHALRHMNLAIAHLCEATQSVEWTGQP